MGKYRSCSDCKRLIPRELLRCMTVSIKRPGGGRYACPDCVERIRRFRRAVRVVA